MTLPFTSKNYLSLMEKWISVSDENRIEFDQKAHQDQFQVHCQKRENLVAGSAFLSLEKIPLQDTCQEISS